MDAYHYLPSQIDEQDLVLLLELIAVQFKTNGDSDEKTVPIDTYF